MLQYLHVKNLALIDEIEVEFGRGLNILTGETGAGKSIILGSVNLALGGRYTKDILRQGTRYGLVELTFSVESERQIRRLKELDVYPEDGFVTLQRRLMEGRSVSKPAILPTISFHFIASSAAHTALAIPATVLITRIFCAISMDRYPSLKTRIYFSLIALS